MEKESVFHGHYGDVSLQLFRFYRLDLEYGILQLIPKNEHGMI